MTLPSAREAWAHIVGQQIRPKLVFAHPELLGAHPSVSLHYRGIATLSLKRVQQIAGSVDRWERVAEPGATRPPAIPDAQLLKVARLYNAVISSIITGSTNWTVENGYRNVLATIGISTDGSLRNIIGQEAEQGLKSKILAWLQQESGNRVHEITPGSSWSLGAREDIRMHFGSEPDIEFQRLLKNSGSPTWETVSVVEIKGGTDPAGALERLGAIKKTFDRTPARSRNFLVVGVTTTEMRRQMKEMPMAGHFMFHEVMHSNERWREFINEIFHHTLRLLDSPRPISE